MTRVRRLCLLVMSMWLYLVLLHFNRFMMMMVMLAVLLMKLCHEIGIQRCAMTTTSIALITP